MLCAQVHDTGVHLRAIWLPATSWAIMQEAYLTVEKNLHQSTHLSPDRTKTVHNDAPLYTNKKQVEIWSTNRIWRNFENNFVVVKKTRLAGLRAHHSLMSISKRFYQHSGTIYRGSKSYLVVRISFDTVAENYGQVCHQFAMTVSVLPLRSLAIL